MFTASPPGNPVLVAIGTIFLASAAMGFDPGRLDFISNCKKSIEIPFYTFNNQVVLPVRVNDGIPLNFILDSGSSQAIIFDKRLAKDLNVDLGRKIRFSGAGNTNQVIAYRSIGVKLSIPGISGERLGMVVLSRDYMDMQRFDIHGVVGYQIFSRFAVGIDYGRRMLTLMEPNHYDPHGYHEFDLTIKNAKPYIDTEIVSEDNHSIPVKLLLDTGAAFGLSLITGSHPQIQVPSVQDKVRIGWGLGGEIMGYKSRSHIRIGPDSHTEVYTVYINPHEYTQKGNLKEDYMGSIGGEFLRDYRVIIDYINQKAYLMPLAPEYLTDNNKR